MKLIAYTRVSTEEQAMEGSSLAAQRELVKGYCAIYGHELVGVVEDAGWSASTMDRPGLQDVLERLKRGEAEGLIVAKLDRLTRNLGDMAKMLDQFFGSGAKRRYSRELVSVAEHIDTKSAMGGLIVNVLISVAQWEREAIGERTSTVLVHKRGQRQKYGSKPPYGWMVDGSSLVPHEGERQAVAMARLLRQHGCSLRAIGAQLEAAGHRTRNGSVWRPATVACLLRSAENLLADTDPTP